MKCSRFIGVFLILAFAAQSSYADGLRWDSVYGRIGRSALQGAIQGAVTGEDKEDAAKGFLAGALSQVADEVYSKLVENEQVSDAYAAQGIRTLRSSIDPNTTWEEYEAILAQINVTMAAHEARVAELENQVSQDSRSISDLDQRVTKNRISISEVKEHQRRLKERFDYSMKSLDFEIARIKGRQSELEQSIRDEAAQRRNEDLNLQRQIDFNSSDISKLYSLISPETRRTTAARLASKGAIELLKGSDLVDVTRTLQLALAYDKFSEKHVDPGVRYYLAVAYRRAGKMQNAEEMIIEAVTAERFRETPDWFYRIHERFQGDDRKWVESYRRDPRFGVRAPRDVVIQGEDVGVP